jgi:hypothetical protein
MSPTRAFSGRRFNVCCREGKGGCEGVSGCSGRKGLKGGEENDEDLKRVLELIDLFFRYAGVDTEQEDGGALHARRQLVLQSGIRRDKLRREIRLN